MGVRRGLAPTLRDDIGEGCATGIPTRVILVACFGPFIGAGLVGLMIVGHLFAWFAGAMFGLGTALVIAMRESPPWYVEKWQLGAEGERKTEKVLKKLERSRWLVVHDVACARGNYDHIVVGAGGVFLLDTKNLQGIVHMAGGAVPAAPLRPGGQRVVRLDPLWSA